MSDAKATDMMFVEEDVVRDLRHSVGNHFHKLYYWADRLGTEEEAQTREALVESLNGALQRFHEFLELGLKYFEADPPSLCDMRVADIASAMKSLLCTELRATGVSLDVSPDVGERVARLDPQRFSLAVRLVVGLLGGDRRESFACRLKTGGGGDGLEVSIEASGGEAPLETPVMEWAIARKTVAMQGGVLQSTKAADGRMGGCVVSLQFAG